MDTVVDSVKMTESTAINVLETVRPLLYDEAHSGGVLESYLLLWNISGSPSPPVWTALRGRTEKNSD